MDWKQSSGAILFLIFSSLIYKNIYTQGMRMAYARDVMDLVIIVGQQLPIMKDHQG